MNNLFFQQSSLLVFQNYAIKSCYFAKHTRCVVCLMKPPLKACSRNRSDFAYAKIAFLNSVVRAACLRPICVFVQFFLYFFFCIFVPKVSSSGLSQRCFTVLCCLNTRFFERSAYRKHVFFCGHKRTHRHHVEVNDDLSSPFWMSLTNSSRTLGQFLLLLTLRKLWSLSAIPIFWTSLFHFCFVQ